ncbi:hypothetical protein TrST_g6206 [Triparma strigata]|uniref:Myb-like domain-containing protein n=1 Tax=Triparma strigata TaxID=1606541 RepID=A0A9W7BDF5_9STRA|nr:hypothetical protein TrST_g6206 [Triparma strigata]
MPNESRTQRHPVDVIEALLILPKREEGYIHRNEERNSIGDLMEEDVDEDVDEVVVEEVVVGVKRKAGEPWRKDTKPRKTKKKGKGHNQYNLWTAVEDDALQKGVGKYGLDFKQIREDNGKVLADKTPAALKQHLFKYFPEEYKAARAVTPRKRYPNGWTAEEDDAMKRGMKKFGRDWDGILRSENKVLGRRTAVALWNRYAKINKK